MLKTNLITLLLLLILIYFNIDIEAAIKKSFPESMLYIKQIAQIVLVFLTIAINSFIEKLLRGRFSIKIKQRYVKDSNKKELSFHSTTSSQKTRTVVVSLEMKNSFGIFHRILKKLLKNKKIELVIKLTSDDAKICYLSSDEFESVNKASLKKDISEKTKQLLNHNQKTDNKYSFFFVSNIEKNQVLSAKTIIVEADLELNLNYFQRLLFCFFVNLEKETFKVDVNFDENGG